MRYLPVGSQVYGYVQQSPEGIDLASVFADVATAGYEGIELFARMIATPAEADRVRELSAQYQLPVIAAYLSGPFWEATAATRLLEAARVSGEHLHALGGRYLVLGTHPSPESPTKELIARQSELLEELSAVADDCGLRALYHTYPADLHDGERWLVELSERIGDLALAADLNWIRRAGVDPLDFLRRWGARVRHLHLRDQTAAGRWTEALGEGVEDFAAYREVLDVIEYEGWLMVELANEPETRLRRPIGESLRRSREHLATTMGV